MISKWLTLHRPIVRIEFDISTWNVLGSPKITSLGRGGFGRGRGGPRGRGGMFLDSYMYMYIEI
jgi:hypothetical protein